MARRHKKWWMALGSFLAYWGWRRWRSGKKHEKKSTSADRASRERGHEPEDRANVRFLSIAGFGLLALLVVILFLLAGFFNLLNGHFMKAPAPFENVETKPPGPRLQPDPAIDLEDMHEYENRRLLHYGWLNKRSGTVHIPIERAMTLIAKRGLPTRDSSAFRDSVRVPTESGFRILQRSLAPSGPPAYLGSSPEPYTTTPAFRNQLNDVGYLRGEE